MQDAQKGGLLTRPPRRAKTHRSAGKAAAPWLTLVSRFTPHVSRLLRAKRERRWRTFSASCYALLNRGLTRLASKVRRDLNVEGQRLILLGA